MPAYLKLGGHFYFCEMLYPKNIEEKLGFDRIRSILKEYCEGTLGEEYVEKIRFTSKPDVIDKLITQTEEFLEILVQGGEFPHNNFVDISESLKKAEIEGTWLSEEECYQLKKTFTTLHECLRFFEKAEPEEFPQLRALAEQVTFDGHVLKMLESILDEKGKIRDNASKALLSIRQQIQREQQAMQRRLERVFQSYKKQGFIKDDLGPTLRDGRLVLPVPAEHKRHVKGFIHDASASGQTLFIEPEELLNSNNELKDLHLKERQEIIRILTEVTNKIRPETPSLHNANRYLGMMDFIRAKARLAQELEAISPPFVREPYVEWYHAAHPLLALQYRNTEKNVVRQHITLSAQQRVLVISGPNAGGKSVALKTVGLVQYMFQSGLMVPVAEGSRMGIFESIFIDMGDEQSLENDLSTYSSHLTNMRQFTQKATEASLCLIDEFGAGTEPELGAAIAEAILETLNQKRVFGVITTHYANLKFFADRTEGLINGAMRYDVDNIRPLYKLEMGMPGSSFALEIAKSIGLSPAIVDLARQKAGSGKVNIEKLLVDLERERKEAEILRQEAERKDRELKVTLARYQQLNEELQHNRKKLMSEAKAEASRLLQAANQKIEQTIRDIRENKAEKELTKQLRKDLEAFKTSVKVEQEETAKEEVAPLPEVKILGGRAEVGDYVQLIGQETVGEVLEVTKKDATVRVGDLKTKIKINKLLRISKREYLKSIKAKEKAMFSKVSYTADAVRKNEVIEAFSPNLDLRGKRAEELLPILQDFIDSALMLDQKSLRIVHGKGDGVLRQIVRDYLRTIKEAVKVTDEHADRGGAGVTLVSLS